MNEDKKCCSSDTNCCGSKKGKIIIIALGIILLAGVMVVALVRDRIVNPPYRQVTITGQGKIAYQPDIALVTLGIQVDKAPKADEALKQINDKMAEIIKALKALGISDENIQTQNYSLLPQYEYKDNVSSVSGYGANEQLLVKVVAYDKTPDMLAKVIATASAAGANQVLNLSFDVSTLNDLKQAARLKAIADAKSKSRVLAQAAGVELKDVTSWYENFIATPQTYAPMYSSAMGMGGGGMVAGQTPNGTREIIVEIGLTYNLK